MIKSRRPRFKAIAVEPNGPTVITQTRNGVPLKPGPHKMQVHRAGSVPKNLNLEVVDDVVAVTALVQ